MDLNQLTMLLNVQRERYEGKELTQEKLREILPNDFRNNIYKLELAGIVNVFKRGTRKIYTFPKEPIHIDKVKMALKKEQKIKKLNEKDCIAFLKSIGYKIYKKEYVEV